MKTRFDGAQEIPKIPKKGYASMKGGLDTVTPALRRVLEDKETREALRHFLSAGKEVTDHIRGGGARATVRGLSRNRRLSSDIESGAKALHTAANAMAKARKKEKRRMFGRAMAVLTLIGALAAVLRNRSRTPSTGDDGVAQWSHPADGSHAGAQGTDRPAGAPIRTA